MSVNADRSPVTNVPASLGSRVASVSPQAVRGDSFAVALADAADAVLTPEVQRDAHRRLHLKAAIVAVWYLGSYLAVVLSPTWWTGLLACTSLALAIAGVGFNIQHDANHNAFFSTSGTRRLTWSNRIVGWSMYALGASATRWIEGHVLTHHSATNIVGKDFDIQLEPIARLAPLQRRRRWHRFQHLYLWAIYAFTAVSIQLGDVIGTVTESFTKNRHGKRPSAGEYATLLSTKAVFAVAMIGVPLLTHSWLAVLLGALYTTMVCGLVLGVVFQMAHAVEQADFRSGSEPASTRWHEWQIRTSVDFAQGTGPVARMVTWYAGGLNYQTEHHLFPRVPHTAYPLLAPAVRGVCDRYGVAYHVHPTLRDAVASHYRHVRALGRPIPAS